MYFFSSHELTVLFLGFICWCGFYFKFVLTKTNRKKIRTMTWQFFTSKTQSNIKTRRHINYQHFLTVNKIFRCISIIRGWTSLNWIKLPILTPFLFWVFLVHTLFLDLVFPKYLPLGKAKQEYSIPKFARLIYNFFSFTFTDSVAY